MLTELDIRNVGPIKNASMTFHAGMTAITGETGAGKSMLLSAITMINGANPRRNKDALSDSYAQGIFDTNSNKEYISDDGMSYVSRTFNDKGHSKCMMSGFTVPRQVLIDTAQIVIHGQSEQIGLASPTKQITLLDTYAHNDDILHHYETIHNRIAQLRKRLAATKDIGARQDYLEDGVRRIEDANISIGEMDELRESLKTGEKRQELYERKQQALGLLESALDSLHRIAYEDNDLGDAMSLLDDVDIKLNRELSDEPEENVDVDAINSRLYELEHIIKRFGGSETSTVAWLNDAKQELDDIVNTLNNADEIHEEIQSLITDEQKIADILHTRRVDGAQLMQSAINTELEHLSMPGASIVINVSKTTTSKSNGYDDVEFMFVPFREAMPMPLGESASGGELSRLMLAIELVSADERKSSSPVTFVFDEVDAGVGGKAAIDLGQRLARLATHAQVIIVTHLAQVAGYADSQYVVRRDGGITTIINADTDDRRELEIARMLSGEQDDISCKHAASLLAKCEQYKQKLTRS